MIESDFISRVLTNAVEDHAANVTVLGAASKKVVVLGGGGCWGGGFCSVPDHNFRSKNYRFLFLLPFDAEALKTLKNTIKLINL